MKSCMLCCLLLLNGCVLLAQSATERIVYLDSTFNETNQINQQYYRIISDFYKSQPTYKMTDYYLSGAICAVGYSNNNQALRETGQFRYYYENGNKKETINYENAVPVGPYLSWYENGNPQIEGEYLRSEKDNYTTGPLKINQFWNWKNSQTVTDGNGYFDLTTEKGCDEGAVVNGLKSEMWAGTNNRFKFNYIEKYNTGKLSVGISTDENKIPHIYREINIRPEFPGGIEAFYHYVGRNFRVPEVGGLNGKVLIGFYIEKDGSIHDVKIIKSINPEVDREAYRVMSECPNWNSAILRGIKIRIKYSLPINIQSGN